MYFLASFRVLFTANIHYFFKTYSKKFILTSTIILPTSYEQQDSYISLISLHVFKTPIKKDGKTLIEEAFLVALFIYYFIISNSCHDLESAMNTEIFRLCKMKDFQLI